MLPCHQCGRRGRREFNGCESCQRTLHANSYLLECEQATRYRNAVDLHLLYHARREQQRAVAWTHHQPPGDEPTRGNTQVSANCIVCMEVTELIPSVRQSSEEQWETKQLCTEPHEFCADCLKGWVASCVGRASAAVCCPHPGCTVLMLPEDIARVAPAQLEAVKGLLRRDFTVRAAEVAVGLPLFPSDYPRRL